MLLLNTRSVRDLDSGVMFRIGGRRVGHTMMEGGHPRSAGPSPIIPMHDTVAHESLCAGSMRSISWQDGEEISQGSCGSDRRSLVSNSDSHADDCGLFLSEGAAPRAVTLNVVRPRARCRRSFSAGRGLPVGGNRQAVFASHCLSTSLSLAAVTVSWSRAPHGGGGCPAARCIAFCHRRLPRVQCVSRRASPPGLSRRILQCAGTVDPRADRSRAPSSRRLVNRPTTVTSFPERTRQ
jgi:hypothetical protein